MDSQQNPISSGQPITPQPVVTSNIAPTANAAVVPGVGTMAPTGQIPSARQLFAEAFTTYKQKFQTLIMISLISVGAWALMDSLVQVSDSVSTNQAVLTVVSSTIVVTIIACIASLWSTAGLVIALRDNTSWRDALQKATPWIGPLLGLSIIITALVIGGFILFIIPGIIFSLWFAFALFVAVNENMPIFAALSRSKYYVSGRLGSVFGKVLYIGLISFLIYVVIGISNLVMFFVLVNSTIAQWDQILSAWSTILWSLVALFLTPLYTVYMYKLYTYLKATRG